MAEKGNKPKPTISSPGPKARRQTKPWQKRDSEQKKKDPEVIPVLKYCPANNFIKFRDALSKAALKEYGEVGKLIKQEKMEKPKAPDRAKYNFQDPDGIDKALYLEELKLYHRKMEEFERNGPRLYGLILQYLSNESLDVIKRDPDWADTEAKADPEKLWELIVQKHKVHSASKVEQIVKLSARQMYRNVRQGGYESITTYKERFDNALAIYQEQQNVQLEDEDIAMNFFSGLDNGHYAEFKATYLNGLTVKSITAPQDLNEIYTIASQWIKPKASGAGTVTTFATTLDKVESSNKKDGKNKKRNGKGKSDKKFDNKQKEEDGTGGTGKKPVKCFKCGADHYINQCPELKKNRENKEDEEERLAAVAYEHSTFATYQVNAVGYTGFKQTKVLLDNQANISIMHPRLLRLVKLIDEEVKINGVGGL
jgi:hypothetical protein